MATELTEKELNYIIENSAKKLIKKLPDCRVLIFYPELVLLLTTFIEEMDENIVRSLFPALNTLIEPTKQQLIVNLKQKNKIILSNIFVTNPCVDVDTVTNSQLYNLNRNKFQDYIIQAGFSFTSDEYKNLFDMLSDAQCTSLLRTLNNRQVFSLMTLLSMDDFMELVPILEGFRHNNHFIGVF